MPLPVAPLAIFTPRAFAFAPFPAALVPMKLLAIELPAVPAAVIDTPLPPLPEMMFRADAVPPPTPLPVDPWAMRTPSVELPKIIVAWANAPEPPPPLRTMTGGNVYPEPGLVRYTPTTTPPEMTAVPAAPAPPPPEKNTVGAEA